MKGNSDFNAPSFDEILKKKRYVLARAEMDYKSKEGSRMVHLLSQGCNNGKMLAATSAMVGRICPPWLR